MKNIGFSILLVLTVLSATLSACSNAGATPAAQAVQIATTEPPPAPSATPTASATPEPSATPAPTNTPLPSDTPTATIPPCHYQAELERHLMGSPGIVVKPEEWFVMIWRIRNSGDCPWTEEFSLVFTEGEQMFGQASIPLPHAVAPGETVDLRIDLIGPMELDYHTGNWMLKTADGQLFGLGEAGSPLEVTVLIKPTPKATSP